MAQCVAAATRVSAATPAVVSSSFVSGRALRRTPVVPKAVQRAGPIKAQTRPLWYPGAQAPDYLDGTLPGDYGFDPLGFCSDPASLKWFQQAELVHCRWSMLGVAGILIPEALTHAGILNTPHWYDARYATYWADQSVLAIIASNLFAFVEIRRWADIEYPGSVNEDPIHKGYSVPNKETGYPGGLWFDPLGFASGDAASVKDLRTKEITNGRLAMIAFLGYVSQYLQTGTGPIENLQAHLTNPGFTNVLN